MLWVVADAEFLRSCCFVSLNSDIEFILVGITGRNLCGFGLFFAFFIFFGNNIDVDPQLIFLRELVILNGCEGSQAAFKIDASLRSA